MENYIFWWIGIFVFACFVEVITQQLVSIWFAAGSLICVFLSYFGMDLTVQLIVFIVVSSLTMLLLRPYAKKRSTNRIITTNVDDIPGRKAIVLEDFDSEVFEGRVLLDGMDWAAKSKERIVFLKGDEVLVCSVEGAKVIVSKEER